MRIIISKGFGYKTNLIMENSANLELEHGTQFFLPDLQRANSRGQSHDCGVETLVLLLGGNNSVTFDCINSRDIHRGLDTDIWINHTLALCRS